MADDDLSEMAGESALAQHIAYERGRRGWSQNKLTRLLNEAGTPINQSAVSKIEHGDRKTTVDELLAFSKVFELPIERLVQPPSSAAVRELFELLTEARARSTVVTKGAVELGPVLERLTLLARTATNQDQIIEGQVRPLLDDLEAAATAIAENKRTTARILKGATRGKR